MPRCTHDLTPLVESDDPDTRVYALLANLGGYRVCRLCGKLGHVGATGRFKWVSNPYVERSVREKAARLVKPVALPTPEQCAEGLRSVIGKWPGEETDEQVDAALREMS